MPSKTSIANEALLALEMRPVASFDAAEGSVLEAMRAVWDQARDDALSDHPWNFALRWYRDQAAVAAASNPSPEWSYAYAIPADAVKVERLYGGAAFEVLDGHVCTDAPGPLHIQCIRRVPQIGKWSVWFAKAMAHHLALKCIKLSSGSEAVRANIKALKDEALAGARSTDGREGVPLNPFPDTFLAARDGWEGDY